MANSLNKDLRGKTVLLKKHIFRPEYQDEKYRRVKVIDGFGSVPFTVGKMMVVESEFDGERFSVSGYNVQKIVKEGS